MGFRENRIGIAVLTAILIVAFCAVPVFGATSGKYSPYKTGQATGSELNIRADASTSAKVLGRFEKGDKMALRGYKGDWYKISYGGKTAYVSKKYVKKVSTLSYIIATPARTGKVKGDDVRVRAGASTKSAIKTTYNKGKSVSITGTKKGGGYNWYRIKYGKSVAYICTDYVKLDPVGTKADDEPVKPAVKDEDVTYSPVKTCKMKVTDNVRTNPASDGKTLGKMSKGYHFTVTGHQIKNGVKWYKTVYDGNDAYIKADNVSVIKDAGYTILRPFKKGIVTATALNVRKGPSTSTDRVGSFANAQRITLRGYIENEGTTWYRVKAGDEYGYVSKDYVADAETVDTPADNNVQGTGPDRIYELAMSKVGCKYVWGDEGPDTFDCSGFTWWVVNTADVTKVKFSRDTSSNQYKQVKKYRIKDATQAQKGDILFYGTGKVEDSMPHTGICIGDGLMVHAANNKDGVIISKITWKPTSSQSLQAAVRLPYK